MLDEAQGSSHDADVAQVQNFFVGHPSIPFSAHRHRARTTPLAASALHTRNAQLLWRRGQRTSDVPIWQGANAPSSRVKPLF